MFNFYGKRTENSCTILPKSRRQSRRRFGIIYPEQKEPSRTAKTQQGERKRIMAIKIGINGFGRIGRLVFRAAICADDIEVVAVNAPDKTPEQLAYTVKYDSVHGRFNGTVDFEEGENPALIVNGKRVALLNNRDAKLLPWGELGVEYVLECTGAFLTKEKAQDHLDAGAQVVVLSGPSKDDTPMFVCGVNLDKYTSDMTFVSNASCTTNPA